MNGSSANSARHRRDEFGPQKRKRFLEAYSKSANIRSSCRAAGIDRQTFYNHEKADPEFAAQVEAAKIEATELLEAVAWHKATVEKDNTSLWNLLKAHKPELYRDTLNTNTSGETHIYLHHADEEYTPNGS